MDALKLVTSWMKKLTSNMPRINKSSKWRPVSINPAYLQSSDADGLVSLQELTDYTVLPDGTIKEIQESDGKSVGDINKDPSSKKKKKQQRKRSEAAIKDGDDGSSEVSELTQKQKKKAKGKAAKKDNEITLNNNTPVDDDESQEIRGPVQKKKKKRKKKKKNQQKTTNSVHGSENDEENGDEPSSEVDDVYDVNEELLKEAPQEETSVTAKRKNSKVDSDGPQKKKKKESKGEDDIEKRDGDQKGPPKDMSAWMNLFVPDQVLEALEEQNFTQPTPIQSESLPAAIRDRRDVVGAAQTGSGKTLAFAIPILHGIMRLKEEEKNEAMSDVDGEDDEEGDEHYDSSPGEEDDDEEVEDLGIPVVAHPDDGPLSDEDSDVVPEDDMEEDEEIEGDEIGCVRTVHNVSFDWLEKPSSEEATKPLYALILTPTRELAIQVRNHISAAAKYTGINCVAIVGGMSVQKQQRLLKKGPEIIVATPGRLWELYTEMTDHLVKLPSIRFLVLDEADRMVEKGHFEELEKILGTVNSDARNEERRQSFVFSATLTFIHKTPERLFLKKKKKKKVADMTVDKKLDALMAQVGIREKPKIIDLTVEQRTAETLAEARINCGVQEKDLYLYYLLQQYPQRTLVFCNSKDCIRRLFSIFSLLKCCPLPLHADMQQRQRLKNLDRFKGNPRGLLLATDVAARGLDIPGVEHVVHYQVPRTTENYVHRSGRTARALKEGLSIMMVSPDDLNAYRKIIKSLNRDADLSTFPVETDFLAALKPRLSLAWSLDAEEHKVSKKKKENAWFEKQAKEMDIDLDEDLLNDLGSSFEQAKKREKLDALKIQLDDILKEPVIRRKQSGKYLTQMGKLSLPFMTDKTSNDAVDEMKNEGKKKCRKRKKTNAN